MPWPGAVAVSGGSDSVALMHLLRGWARSGAVPPPVVLTVDHGLRPGSTADARAVVRAAKALGLKVQILKWDGEKPAANIEAMARETRYALMGAWCRANGTATLYLGHTRDDQAETFLLRLARGTGLDGLSGMAAIAPWPVQSFPELSLARPLLKFEREALRNYLTESGTAWREDSTNADPRFARNRIRAVWPVLEEAGLTKGRIADAAAHLARARFALETVTKELIARAAVTGVDGVVIDAAVLRLAPREVALRALAAMLTNVSNVPYRPRFERLESLFDALISGGLRKARTLHGCRIGPAPKMVATFGANSVLIERERDRRKPDVRTVRT
ncbi:MAG TPA: tRNA lysidine(34) synthetase TilS [Rhizomicrobium sp.]